MTDDNVRIIFSQAEQTAQQLTQEAGVLYDGLDYLRRTLNSLLNAGFEAGFRAEIETRAAWIDQQLRTVADEVNESGHDLQTGAEKFREVDRECALIFDIGWRDHADHEAALLGMIADNEQLLDHINSELSGLNYWKNLMAGTLDDYQRMQAETQARIFELRERLAYDMLADLEGLKPEVWVDLSMEEREAVMRQVHATYAEAYGFNPAEYDVKDINQVQKGLRGQTNGSRILLDDDILKSDDPREAFKTTVHESRHVLQRRAADDAVNYVPDEVVDAWRKNQSSYYSPPPNATQEEFERYKNQVIEQDARDAADEAATDLYY